MGTPPSSSKLSYPQRPSSSPNTITLRIKASISEFHGDKNIQSTAMYNILEARKSGILVIVIVIIIWIIWILWTGYKNDAGTINSQLDDFIMVCSHSGILCSHSSQILTRHNNPMNSLTKQRFLGSTSRDSDSAGLGRDLSICISNKILSNAAASLETMLWVAYPNSNPW